MSFFKKSDETSQLDDPHWERSVLEKVAMASVVEQRRTRRWGIFFKVLFLLYLLIITSLAFMPKSGSSMSPTTGAHTAIVDVSGVIVAGGDADASRIIKSLRNAADDFNTKGIVLRMNTPGGSPVQSSFVFESIRQMKQERPELPIYAVVEDLCASGGYFIAAGTDAIYVNPSSIVGSIGVVMNGFGFVDALESLGVERRLLTAGENKGFLDPFSPVNKREQQHVQKLLNQIHGEFIEAVKTGRGERLKNDKQIFSGLVWAGEESIELGLTDEFGDVDYVAREVIGAEKVVDFTLQDPLFERLAKSVGRAAASTLTQVIGLGWGQPR